MGGRRVGTSGLAESRCSSDALLSSGLASFFGRLLSCLGHRQPADSLMVQQALYKRWSGKSLGFHLIGSTQAVCLFLNESTGQEDANWQSLGSLPTLD